MACSSARRVQSRRFQHGDGKTGCEIRWQACGTTAFCRCLPPDEQRYTLGSFDAAHQVAAPLQIAAGKIVLRRRSAANGRSASPKKPSYMIR